MTVNRLSPSPRNDAKRIVAEGSSAQGLSGGGVVRCLRLRCLGLAASAALMVMAPCSCANLNKPDSSLKQDERNDTLQGGSAQESRNQNTASRWTVHDTVGLVQVTGHKAEIIGIFAPPFEGREPDRPAVTVDKSGLVLLWKLSRTGSWKLLQAAENVEQAAYCPDSNLLALSSGGTIDIYSLSSRTPLARLEKIRTRLTGLGFQPDCRAVVAGGTDAVIYRWKFLDEQAAEKADDTDAAELALERYAGHSTVVSAVTFHPYGRFFFSGDWRGSLYAWLNHDSDLYSGEYNKNVFAVEIFTKKAVKVKAERVDAQQINSLAVSPDGQNLFVALQDGRVEWWDVRGFKKLAEVPAHKGMVYDLALSPGGGKLLSAGRDGWVRSWLPTRPADSKSQPALAKGQEVQVADVHKLGFAGENVVLAGEKDGRLLNLDL